MLYTKPKPTIDHVGNLIRKFETREALIGVVGAGYVGLPLAVEKAKVGFHVVAYDRNPERVAKLNAGTSYIRDVGEPDLRELVNTQHLRGSLDFSDLGACDAIVICVPTPLTANRDPDISYIRDVGKQIASVIRPGQLICLESTTYPGTTEEVLLPMFAVGDLKVGSDFFLAFSPERVDPGNARYTTKNTNKVVGGITPNCGIVASAFYQQTIINVVPVSCPKVAEMTKVFENTFRAVNIALVNEMTLLCDRLGISIWEVIDAAGTKPFGLMRFEPGPGVGGHCIPIDPFYLTWKAHEVDFSTRFIELAGEINLHMPYFVREKVIRALNRRSRALHGAQILVVGVSYKRDIDDWRESPALKVMELLEKEGAAVSYHDPFVPAMHLRGRRHESVKLTEECVRSADCVLILTDHSCIDWAWLIGRGTVVVDTRNATRTAREMVPGADVELL